MAMYDMSNEFSYKAKLCDNKDVWFVFPSRLLNKHTRYLNKILGINKINYANRYK